MQTSVLNDVKTVAGLATVEVARLVARALDGRDAYRLDELERGWLIYLHVDDVKRVARSLLEELDLGRWHVELQPYRTRDGAWTHRIILTAERRKVVADVDEWGRRGRQVVPA